MGRNGAIQLKEVRMEKHISDFMVHVDDFLTPDEQNDLEDYVRHQACVVSAGMSAEKPHLMMVAYDSECGPARNILHQIRQKGIRAEMIGF
jgi:hypothetical protein